MPETQVTRQKIEHNEIGDSLIMGAHTEWLVVVVFVVVVSPSPVPLCVQYPFLRMRVQLLLWLSEGGHRWQINIL